MPLVLEPCQSNGMVQGSAPFTVFLVEDSPAIRQRAVQMLRDQSIGVVGQAQSPKEAADGILATRPDVVVLDIQLDGGTGLEVMRAVRPVDSHIAFIVLSNNVDPAYRKLYRKLYRKEGALHFFDKSADIDPLAPTVKAVAQASALPKAPPRALPRALPARFDTRPFNPKEKPCHSPHNTPPPMSFGSHR